MTATAVGTPSFAAIVTRKRDESARIFRINDAMRFTVISLSRLPPTAIQHLCTRRITSRSRGVSEA